MLAAAIARAWNSASSIGSDRASAYQKFGAAFGWPLFVSQCSRLFQHSLPTVRSRLNMHSAQARATCGNIKQDAAYSVNPRAPLHGPANTTGRRTQGPYSVQQTPSAELVWLGFVERAWFGARRWLRTRLGFRLLRNRQLFWLGMPLSTSFAHDLDHQHGAHPSKWGDAKSPG